MNRLIKKSYFYDEDEIINKSVSLTDIHVSRDSIFKTLQDINSNRKSHSNGPLECWLFDGLLYLTDGFHRLVEGILKDKDQFNINIIGEGYSDYNFVSENECVQFNLNMKYKGLEDVWDEEVLDNLCKKI